MGGPTIGMRIAELISTQVQSEMHEMFGNRPTGCGCGG